MLVEVKVPVLSESISDAVLLNWHKHVGDFIAQDENLIDLETDKVVLEITAPEPGTLKEIKKNSGTRVESHEVIALIDTEAVNEALVNVPGSTEVVEPAAEVVEMERKASPAARKIMAEHQIQQDQISGTGKGQRITKADVVKVIDHSLTNKSTETMLESIDPPMTVGFERQIKRVPMTRLRARIAERLKQAQNVAAILTTFNEINMQPVMDVRSRYREKFQMEKGVKLGFMSFFTKAVVEALKKYPVINASVDGEDIIYHNYYDIGIAVTSPRGLVVPIVRDADQLSFAQIENKIKSYTQQAQDATLSMEDLSGGTFTITNGGIFGSMLSTPILNPPQSAILGMHAIKERPVAENGEVKIRPVMYVAMSYDHRIIDGQEAVRFLVTIKEALEDPTRLLLQI